MFKHILIPLDGTAQAETIIPAGAAIASRAGAKVTLLHILEKVAPKEVHGERHLRTAEEAEPYLARIAAKNFPAEIEVARHVHAERMTDVAEGLADHVDELHPDLVVMCAHGGPRIRDMLFGNLAQQTLSRGRIPVLLAKNCPKGCNLKQMLVPLDGNPEHDKPAIEITASLARLFSAHANFLYVVPPSDAPAADRPGIGRITPAAGRAVEDIELEEATTYLETVVEKMGERGLEVTGKIAFGAPVEKIAGVAVDSSADLVILATHGKAGTRAFWSASVAARLVSRLDLAFLLVPAR